MEGKELLLADLEAQAQSPARDLLIERARREYYSDFASPVATPLLMLHAGLMKLGWTDMAKKVTQDKYDHDQ